jgi:predicted Ser/Thr protein kinase
LQIPIDSFVQRDSKKLVLKEKLGAGAFGQVWSCSYDGEERVCKLIRDTDYHEILVNELKEKQLKKDEDLVKYLKGNSNIKTEQIDDEDFEEYRGSNTRAYFITPGISRSDLNLKIFQSITDSSSTPHLTDMSCCLRS